MEINNKKGFNPWFFALRSMIMIIIIGVILGTVFILLSLLHFARAFGFSFGDEVTVPEVDGKPAFVPTNLMTLAVALALAAAALIVLAQSGAIAHPLDSRLLQIACGVLGAVFVLRAVGEFKLIGFFKKVRGTRFAWWDDVFFSPLCLLLGGGALWLTFAA